MWHASTDKKLVLSGKLKELFLEGVYEALNDWFLEGDIAIEDDEDGLSYVQYSQPYEGLSNREKLWGVAEVTRCLATKCRTPPLLQWNESVVYAVFETIAAEISVEIDNERHGEAEEEYRFHWRKLASEAQRELIEYDEPEEYIDPKSDDHKEWERVVTEELAGTILWDDDFLECNAKIVCDNSPERAEMLKYLGGIPDDYYSTPVPHVTDEMLRKAKRFLKKTFNELYGSRK